MQASDDVNPIASRGAPMRAWYALAVLIGTTLFAFVDRQLINLIAPTFQKMLGLSDLELGLLHGVGMALFAAAAGYPVGWLADRFGRRLVFAACILLWSLSTAACAFQTSFTGLFIATAGIAIGEAALAPVIFSMLPDIFPERQRNTANFIFFASVLLGAAAGVGLGGLTLDWLAHNQHVLPGFLAEIESWRAALILGAVPAPFFMLLLATIRMRSHSGQVIASADAALTQILPFVRSNWRVLVFVYGGIGAYALPLNACFTWLPVIMPRIFGVEPAAVGMQMGISVAIGTVTGLLLAPVGNRLFQRHGVAAPLRFGTILMVLAIFPTIFLLFATQPWQIFAAAGAQLMFALGVGALMPGVLQQLSPPALRSRLISILAIVQAIATGLSPVLIGGVSGLIDGPRGLLFALVIVSLPGWVIAALLFKMACQPLIDTAARVAAMQADDEPPADATAPLPIHH